MGMKYILKWVSRYGGEIQDSQGGRFSIIQGSDHYTLLDHGRAIHREVREDFLKEYAETLVKKVES